AVHDLRRGSLAVVSQRARARHVGAVALFFEHVATLHLATVDVQRYRGRSIGRVTDAVVFVRRNQASGAADACFVRIARFEPESFIAGLRQLVLLDVDTAAPHALDAPHPAVVVNRRGLAGAPGHHDNRVSTLVVPMYQAASVVTVHLPRQFGGQFDLARPDQAAEPAIDRLLGLGD